MNFEFPSIDPVDTQDLLKPIVIQSGNRTKLIMKEAVYHNDVQFGLIGVCILISVFIIIFLVIRSCQLRAVPVAVAHP